MRLAIFIAVVALFVPAVQAAIIFDDFNVNEGHFTSAPNLGSNSNVKSTSTANRVTPGAMEGAGFEQLVLQVGTTNPARSQFLSGGGTRANNPHFTLTSGTDGYIGFYARTSHSGVRLSVNLDDSSDTEAGLDGGVLKTVTADGQWHLYEWNLDRAADWIASAGFTGSDGVLQTGSRSIDSIYITNLTVNTTIDIDFVAKSDSGSISGLVTPEPASLVLLLAGSLLMRRSPFRHRS